MHRFFAGRQLQQQTDVAGRHGLLDLQHLHHRFGRRLAQAVDHAQARRRARQRGRTQHEGATAMSTLDHPQSTTAKGC